MRTLTRLVLLALLLLAPLAASAQETDPPEGTRITSAQVSGFEFSRLSPGLQEQISKLAGSPLNRQQLRDLAARIEAEHPRFVAALRVVADAEGGARVAFVVARMRDPETQTNINTKYVVEDAQIRGVSQSAITPELRADLQALTGKPLDAEQAERLETRLKSVFPQYDVTRRTTRGSQPGQIKVIFHLFRNELSRWLRYEPLEANLIYHSDQGWGAKMPLTISGGDMLIVPFFAVSVADDLIEEYSGGGLRFESRRLGTERLGAFFQWATFDTDWREQTVAALAANPLIPAAYRSRRAVTPLVKFAISPRLTVGGGVSIAELDALDEASADSRMANAAIGLVTFNQHWKQASGGQHDLEISFTMRKGTEALQSDLEYERYVGQADYSYRRPHHRVLVSGGVGSIDGAAPLFERFSLGSSSTLRGWNKYDIAPVGGDRVVYSSVEYRFRGLMLFLDAGSVWDAGAEKKMRFSTGFGFSPGPVFFNVGFPLNTSEFGTVFTMGIRLPTATVGFQK